MALPYVYNGDPFRPGPFPVNTRILNKGRDHVPVHTDSERERERISIILYWTYTDPPPPPPPPPSVQTILFHLFVTHTHHTVYFPSSPGTYVPILFISGLNGVVFPEFYSTVLANFAAYGYIIAGIDPYYPVLASIDDSVQADIEKSLPEKTFELLKWVREKIF